MLEINDFSLDFHRYEHSLFRKSTMRVISGLDLSVKGGEVVAVIGSSGAGKSLLAHAILGILPKNVKTSGSIIYRNKPLTEKRSRELRGKEIVLIPQSVSFLNPLNTSGKQVYRSAFLYSNDKQISAELTDKAFVNYNLNETVKRLYPHEISGGMARRVLTATATISDASLIIADEPTTGLDDSAIDESLTILKDLAAAGKGVVLITHDINAAMKYADKIAVFYAGTTVESAPSSNFKDSSKLKHPYSRALVEALPQNNFSFIPGAQPDGIGIMKGCMFEPRCLHKNEHCCVTNPARTDYKNGFVRCNNAEL